MEFMEVGTDKDICCLIVMMAKGDNLAANQAEIALYMFVQESMRI